MVMNTMLLATPANAALPRRLKRRVMASIGVERPGWGWAAGLAAACLLLIALWLGTQERERAAELADARSSLMQVRGERDQLRQAMSFLNQPETRQVGFGKGQAVPPRGNVFVNPKQRRVADRVESSGARLGQDLRDVGDSEGRRAEAGRLVPFRHFGRGREYSVGSGGSGHVGRGGGDRRAGNRVARAHFAADHRRGDDRVIGNYLKTPLPSVAAQIYRGRPLARNSVRQPSDGSHTLGQ